MATTQSVQVHPPEVEFATELAFLAAFDDSAKPPGWALTPRAIVTFICGSQGEALKLGSKKRKTDVEGVELPAKLEISAKFVGSRALVERCVVTLASERGLLLVGEPGTAKSMLSELLAAGICGSSGYVVQGSAGTTEDQLRYGWNYAMLMANGPTLDALVPSPVLSAMRSGGIARIEEVTRCLPEVQDALISILSERRLSVPELVADTDAVASVGGALQESARTGFNVIATANLRDRGVSEMSSALKRRFNFENIAPIADFASEARLVQTRAARALERVNEPLALDESVIDALVTAFRDLRAGQSAEGWAIERPSTVMSTAEAVAVATSMGLQASYFGGDRDALDSLPGHLLGVVLKDDEADRGKLLGYWDTAVKRRAEDGSRLWKHLLSLRAVLEAQP